MRIKMKDDNADMAVFFEIKLPLYVISWALIGIFIEVLPENPRL